MNIIQSIDAALRLAGDTRTTIAKNPAVANAAGFLSDPHDALVTSAASLAVNTNIHFGTVVDCVPYMQFYRVLPEAGRQLIACTPLRAGSGTPLGVAVGDTYPAGTRVLYAKHPDFPHGWIIAAIPFHTHDPRSARSYSVGSTPCCGIRTDAAFNTPLRLGADGTNGGVVDWSARTPIDSLPAGEYVRVTETGLMISLDAYMAQIRVDAMTGLFLFYWDRLCRLAGYNFQLWTAGSVMESLDDAGEHYWHQGVATYLWEQLGKLDGPGDVFEEHSPEETFDEKPYLGRLEPAELDAQPFVRLQEYGGYLGQGRKTILAAPPPGIPWLRQGESTKIPGLAEDQITLAGHILTRSATGIVIAKQPIIPVPKRIRAHTDREGDNAENYRPAGHESLGDGPEHKVGASPVSEGRDPGNVKAGGLAALHAHLFNWEGLHAFHYHENDYYTPEENECDWVPASHTPSFGALRTEQSLPEPPYTKLKIDHRYGEIRIYHASCSISLMDDGNIVVSDGSGSEIRMVGGNVKIQAAGDISLEAGRNINLQAGRDINARAKQSVDVSATDNDVRLKARNNVAIVGGVSGGPHGVLIESQGTGPQYSPQEGQAAQHSGVIIVSRNAPAVVISRDIYLRTAGSGGSAAGPITLDADRGSTSIHMHAYACARYVTACFDSFGQQGFADAVNVWTANGAYIAGNVGITGAVIANGPMLARGSVIALDGAFFSSQSNWVGRLTGDSASRVAESVNTVVNMSREVLPEQSQAYYAVVFDELLYAGNKPGNADVIENLQFSFRTTQDYGTENWYMHEPRWAQMVRHAGGSTAVWEEQPVVWRGTETYPFPGRQALLGQTYYQVDMGLIDPDTGRAVDRGEAYEDVTMTDYPAEEPTNAIYPIVG